MLLRELVATTAALRDTRSRKRKSELLGDCVRRMDAGEIATGVSFLIGVLPGGKIGVGWAAVRDARKATAATGSSLTIAGVGSRLDDIARVSGPGSAERRARALGELFAAATADEQAFLAHLLVGEMRQGASAGVMTDAIAKAAEVKLAAVRRAVMLCGDLGQVATAAMTGGNAALGEFRLQLFRPVLPMLAQPAGDVADALATIDEPTIELKLDGARVQLHKDGDEVRIYSRRLNDVTDAVPELVAHARSLPVNRLIADGEAIALRADGSPLPFQVTMSRFGRRSNPDDSDTPPLTGLYFDCLLLDADDLLDRPGRDRVAALEQAMDAAARVPRVEPTGPDDAEAFWTRALETGHEGVMVKSLASTYAAGKRGKHWFKVKPAHSLDLVVLAAEWGSGRRRGWLSNLHLGARDPQTGSFVMLGKTFKGMTDEMLAWQTEALQEIALAREDHVVHVEPKLVVEVAFNDVQASPHYPGGMALRFARVKRYRKDKRAEDADTIDAVRAIFAAGR